MQQRHRCTVQSTVLTTAAGLVKCVFDVFEVAATAVASGTEALFKCTAATAARGVLAVFEQAATSITVRLLLLATPIVGTCAMHTSVAVPAADTLSCEFEIALH